jgi:hypothetical protein
MPNSLRDRGQADQLRINLNEPKDVAYWSRLFGVSAQRLQELVKMHGVMASDLRKALGG